MKEWAKMASIRVARQKALLNKKEHTDLSHIFQTNHFDYLEDYGEISVDLTEYNRVFQRKGHHTSSEYGDGSVMVWGCFGAPEFGVTDKTHKAVHR